MCERAEKLRRQFAFRPPRHVVKRRTQCSSNLAAIASRTITTWSQCRRPPGTSCDRVINRTLNNYRIDQHANDRSEINIYIGERARPTPTTMAAKRKKLLPARTVVLLLLAGLCALDCFALSKGKLRNPIMLYCATHGRPFAGDATNRISVETVNFLSTCSKRESLKRL